MPTIRTRFATAVLAAVAILPAGCAAQPATPTAPTGVVATATATATATAITTTDPAAVTPTIQAAPGAELSVDGGDPVVGQLGTFTWGGNGSDGPWLPGTPIRAATGEIMSITPATGVVTTGWSALLAPAANVGGEGASRAGSGDGTTAMDVAAPGAGSWTLAVTIQFGDLGSATYFWLLEVD